jgi:hypothetical protein
LRHCTINTLVISRTSQPMLERLPSSESQFTTLTHAHNINLNYYVIWGKGRDSEAVTCLRLEIHMLDLYELSTNCGSPIVRVLNS